MAEAGYLLVPTAGLSKIASSASHYRRILISSCSPILSPLLGNFKTA